MLLNISSTIQSIDPSRWFATLRWVVLDGFGAPQPAPWPPWCSDRRFRSLGRLQNELRLRSGGQSHGVGWVGTPCWWKEASHAWRRRSYVCWFIKPWTISYIYIYILKYFFKYHIIHIISPLINPSSPKISQGKCWTLTCHQIAGCWTLHHRRDDPFWSSVLTWTSSVCSSGPGDGGEVSSCICCILFGLVTKVFNKFQ